MSSSAPLIRSSSKRQHQDAMGSLVKDAISLEKRQKVMFSQLYSHINSIVTLVEETGSCLTGKPSFGPSSSEGTLGCGNPTPDDVMQPDEGSGTIPSKHYPSGTPTGHNFPRNEAEWKVPEHYPSKSLQTLLTNLATSVKALGVQKSGARSYRDFNNRYSKLGKALFKSGCMEGLDVLSHMGFDEQLVLRMIGMHLLHYGLFDVYDELKSDAIVRWGANCHALVSEAVISAYHILHHLLSQLRKNDIDPLIEWVRANSQTSHLHVERFNSTLLNLYRIQLLNDCYHVKDGVLHMKEFDITNEHICRVKKTAFSQMRNLHDKEIGKLMTQFLLGENLPDPPEFIEMKLATEKMFVKLFCENGTLVKKSSSSSSPPGCTGKSHIHLHHRQRTLVKDTRISIDNNDADISTASDTPRINSTDFLDRRPASSLPTEPPLRESWLAHLRPFHIDVNDIDSYPVSETRGPSLSSGWLRTMERNNSSSPPFPKMNRYRLTSAVLSYNENVERAKRIIHGETIEESCLHNSETIYIMSKDLDTTCRQILPRGTSAVIPDTTHLTQDDGMDTSSDYTGDNEDWGGRGRLSRSVAAVLIAAADNPNLRYITVPNTGRISVPSESPYMRRVQYGDPPFGSGGSESRRDSQPTMSLTLFTASQALRENIISSQTSDNEAPHRVISSEEGRIRITFPPRAELTENISSQGRRSSGRGLRLNPFDFDSSETELNITSAERAAIAEQEREGESGPSDTTNINVRGILRMIMRGISGGASQSSDPVVQLSPGVGSPIPTTGVRHEHHSQIHTRSNTGRRPSTSSYKGGFKTAYEREQGDFVRVFLPCESPISVLVCAGYMIYPRLIDIVDIPRKNDQVSSRIGTWMKSCKQLPIDSDLGPAFCFHSYLTCPISKDQTCSQNLPVMLSCGHVICSLCVSSFGSSRRNHQFKCPMCPQLISPGEMKDLYLDWNSYGLDDPC